MYDGDVSNVYIDDMEKVYYVNKNNYSLYKNFDDQDD